MGITVTGKIHLIQDLQQVTERFQKREFVVEMADNPKYPQLVMFQLTGDRVSSIEGFNVGDDIQVEFSLRGRKWTSPKGEDRYFNSLDVWSIERTAGASSGYNDEQPPPPNDPPADMDDIPF